VVGEVSADRRLDQIVERYRAQEWAEALMLCERGLEADPDALEIGYYQALCLLETERLQEGESVLEAMAACGHLQSQYQLGLLALRQGRRPESRKRAIGHFETIVTAVEAGREYPAIEGVYFALGSQYARDPQRRQEAIIAYRRGLAHDPLSAAGHNSLGQLLLQSGQVLGALGEFKVAIQLDPDLHPAYAQLAGLLFHHVKPADLEQEYRHISAEFADRAPRVLARLSLEMVELGKRQVYEGFYTKGHRIKNLLGIIGSRLRGLGRRAEGDGQQEIERLGSEHEALYDEWVGFLEAMKTDAIRPTVVEPGRLVQRVADAVRTQDWNSELQVRIQQGVPQIEADERMLREAVTNLCLNALEILEEKGGGQVVVGVGYDAVHSQIFIEVEDDGPGIAPEHLELVFEPGFSAREGGNGYGLSIVRRIAQAHHGALRVKSQPRYGAVFRLDLPLNFSAIAD